MSVRFSDLDGARVGVWGAGREIRSLAGQLARRLPSSRIAVAVFDTPAPEDVLGALRAPAAEVLVVAEDDVVAALSTCDVVVRSPGVSIHRPELEALREAGMTVTTATSLWLSERGGLGVIGITGTKGKSTTAALAFHLARAAGRTARLAGNIGVAALDLLDEEPAGVTVLELSSYQTADLQTGPEVAVVTNLFKEHTDWHGSERAYRAEKLRLLELSGVRMGVLNAREELLRAAGERLGSGGVEVKLFGAPDGWDVVSGGIARGGELLVDGSRLALLGDHNLLNLCAALSALEAFGVEPPRLPGALKGFQSLPHRLEQVAERGGVLWVNDSISTTPESTLAALSSFPGRPIVLICGGQDRGQDYTRLATALAEAQATVIGVATTGPRLLAATRDAGVPDARTVHAPDLPAAVAAAGELAREGGVVLLSPAAPSYDGYRDFEERGARFRELVEAR
ncbi:MAG: UDP-N-acetylmuramoyl-L-alanine--D-glutamate ligase [Solirubrobacteraceae bacterium]